MKYLFILLFACAVYAQPESQNLKPYQIRHFGVDQTMYVLIGDGRTDDTIALNAWGSGADVYYKGKVLGNTLENGTFLITWGVDLFRRNSIVRNNTFVIRYTGYDSIHIIHYKHTKYRNNNIIYEHAEYLKTAYYG